MNTIHIDRVPRYGAVTAGYKLSTMLNGTLYEGYVDDRDVAVFGRQAIDMGIDRLISILPDTPDTGGNGGNDFRIEWHTHAA